MKISIITVVYNGEAFIEGCIQSVLSQDYPDVEYILIDGGSKDQTMKLVNKYKEKIAQIVSEPDKGLYDAMNKGINLATGAVVGILNADDFYSNPNVLSSVMKIFANTDTEIVLGDLVVVEEKKTNKVVRYCTAGNFKLKDFEKGDMPPHPSVFVKRNLYEKFGTFNTSFKLAADYDWMLRSVYKGGTTWKHLPKILVHMRTGGMSQSGWKSKQKLNREIKKAADQNGVKTSLLKIYSKYFTKFFQLLKRPSKNG